MAYRPILRPLVQERSVVDGLSREPFEAICAEETVVVDARFQRPTPAEDAEQRKDSENRTHTILRQRVLLREPDQLQAISALPLTLYKSKCYNDKHH